MKKLIVLGLLLFPLLNSYSQTRKELRQQKRTEEYKASKTLVETKCYEFSADKVNPQRGGSIDLTTNPNYLKVNDSIAEASMPFFGRAYNIPYGGSGGINFKGELINYSVEENTKKLRLVVSFRVKSDGDVFDCTLTINSNESVTLLIISQQRESISYYGTIESLETKKQ
jgi:hypothetical protein